MAGGKLSPRQKMINLMYLVLTALLAMNVSKDILNSLEALASSLRKSAEVLQEKNLSTVEDIQASIKKEAEKGNKNNLFLLPILDDIRNTDSRVINFLEKHIKVLKQLGQWDSTTNKLKKPDEVEKNFRYLMMGKKNELANGGRGAGAAKAIHDTLDAFIIWANKMHYKITKKSPPKGLKELIEEYAKTSDDKKKKELKRRGLVYAPIVIEPKANPMVTNAEDKRKTWEIYTFDHNTPVIANIATIEKLKSDVEVIVSDLIELARRQLMQVTFKIDSLMAISAPESKYVIVGMKFKTRLFVAMSSSQIKPKFSSSSGQIKIQPGGNEALLIIRARGSVIPKGKNEGVQRYSALIRVPKADGTEAKLSINGKFIVRKPEVVVTSAAIQIMYRNCANDINVDVPALGPEYNPVIKAKGGVAKISPKNKKKVRVVPTASTLLLKVYTRTGGETIFIDNLKYKVIPPPKPTIVVYENGKVWDGLKPWRKGSRIKVYVKPDKEFKRGLPQDARYIIKNAVVKVKKGLGAATPVKSLGSSGINKPLSFSLAALTRGLPPGTKFYIQMDGIYRVNFAGKRIEEPFSRRELTISGVVE